MSQPAQSASQWSTPPAQPMAEGEQRNASDVSAALEQKESAAPSPAPEESAPERAALDTHQARPAKPKRDAASTAGKSKSSLRDAAPPSAPGRSADEATPTVVEPPKPEYAEPPTLLALVKQFDDEWERLSTSRNCEDACRAYDSMKRSATRICDLVSTGDPRARCRDARSRLDQAGRDLASRCADCR